MPTAVQLRGERSRSSWKEGATPSPTSAEAPKKALSGELAAGAAGAAGAPARASASARESEPSKTKKARFPPPPHPSKKRKILQPLAPCKRKDFGCTLRLLRLRASRLPRLWGLQASTKQLWRLQGAAKTMQALPPGRGAAARPPRAAHLRDLQLPPGIQTFGSCEFYHQADL